MTTILLAAAFLCGVPFGFILGMLVVWRMNRPDRYEKELDYSDGF
jgi:uncharacterized Tic20 family protein